MTRTALPGILAMATIVVVSNILVQFFVGDWLTWGAFTYPLAFLITDLMNRVYGTSIARQAIFAGFIVGIFCSLVGSQVSINLGTEAEPFLAPAVTFRVALASGLAFLTAQLLDVLVFNVFRKKTWWQAPLISSVVGSSVDTALFFFLAFSATAVGLLGADHNTEFFNEVVATPFGFEMTRWVGTGIVDWCVKMGIALIALVPFKVLVDSLAGPAEIN